MNVLMIFIEKTKIGSKRLLFMVPELVKSGWPLNTLQSVMCFAKVLSTYDDENPGFFGFVVNFNHLDLEAQTELEKKFGHN